MAYDIYRYGVVPRIAWRETFPDCRKKKENVKTKESMKSYLKKVLRGA